MMSILHKIVFVITVVYLGSSFAESTIAGIDLGYHTYKVSHYSNISKVIDIVPNFLDQRYRSALTLYKDGVFLFENSALNEYDRYSSLGYPGLVSLLGSQYDDEASVRYRKLYDNGMKKDESTGEITFYSLDLPHPYSVEELLAIQLDNAVANCDKFGINPKKVKTVISIPDMYGIKAKIVLRTAASLTQDIQLLNIVNHSESVATYIASTRVIKDRKIYMVFDSGQSTTCAFTFEISVNDGGDTKEKSKISPIDVTMLSTFCSNEFNIEKIDMGLMDITKSHFISQKSDLDSYPQGYARSIQSKLLRQLSKAKHTLNSADSYIIKVDDPLDKIKDVNFVLEKKHMSSLVEDNKNYIYDVLDKSLEDSKIPKGELDYIVFSGGGSDILMIRKLVFDYVKINNPGVAVCPKISARDVVALGAGKIAAILSKNFKLRSINFTYNYHDDIYISNDASGEIVTQPFFDEPTYKSGYTKAIVVDAKSNFNVGVYHIDKTTQQKTVLVNKKIQGFDDINDYEKDSLDSKLYKVTLTFSITQGGNISLSDDIVVSQLPAPSTETRTSGSIKGISDKLLNIFFNSKNEAENESLEFKEAMQNDIVDNVVPDVEEKGGSTPSPLKYIVLSASDSNSYSGYSVSKDLYDKFKENVNEIRNKKHERESALKNKSDLQELSAKIFEKTGDMKALIEEFMDEDEHKIIHSYAEETLALIIGAETDDITTSNLNARTARLKELIDIPTSRRSAFNNINNLLKKVNSILPIMDVYGMDSRFSSEKANSLKNEIKEVIDNMKKFVTKFEAIVSTPGAQLKAKADNDLAVAEYDVIMASYTKVLRDYITLSSTKESSVENVNTETQVNQEPTNDDISISFTKAPENTTEITDVHTPTVSILQTPKTDTHTSLVSIPQTSETEIAKSPVLKETSPIPPKQLPSDQVSTPNNEPKVTHDIEELAGEDL